MINHCCENMKFFLDEDKVDVHYSPMYREYTIGLKNSNGFQLILFCPWCGKSLPEDLRDEWFTILEDEMKIKVNIDNTENLPKEFLTDTWWKNRGL